MGRILVTGGAGYIGSHIVRRLLEDGRDVIVLDDLSEGHRASVGEVPFVEGNVEDPEILDRVFSTGEIRYVAHMSASCLVGESVSDPAKYYENNVVATLRLLDAVRRYEVEGLVFSSTAAVYGEPDDVPIREEHPCRPANPYGETKFAIERALDWYHRSYGIRYVALRYFNAAGAHPSGELGEDHHPESHLIPRLLRSVVEDGPPVPLFGDDYPTSDGTCVRDYIHVMDLAEAHVQAIDAMARGAVAAEALNLGNGEGFSVREIVEAVGRVAGAPPRVEVAPRRAGDPGILVASSDRARRRLGWVPRFSSVETILETAWNWHRSHPRGFDDRP